MTDINKIKLKVENGEYHYIPKLPKDELQQMEMADDEILSLITTIEQNEVVYKECENLCKLLQKENAEFENTIESQKAEIERLKADHNRMNAIRDGVKEATLYGKELEAYRKEKSK